MYKPISIYLITSLLVLCNEALTAQGARPNRVEISAKTYELFKVKNLLDKGVEYVIASPNTSGQIGKMRKSALRGSDLTSIPCSYVPTDNFQDPWGGQVYFDDSPPAGPFEVQLPFSFCFYDVTYQSFFINNNGNITFEDQYTTFTSVGFPTATIPPMIAPFWGDVDTGDEFAPLGQVRYEVYPDYAIVSWDSVGVYPGTNPDQRNTFQLIITDGASSVLPSGSNLCFLYGDMQWTTGTASSGTGGFGGTPATVGINRGDGINYYQLGQFDAPGFAYDGPFNANDGVDFLDNSVYYLTTCIQPGVEFNIPPQAPNAPICDTLRVCAGIPYEFSFAVTPVEPGQTVATQLTSSTIPGFSIVNLTNGDVSTVSALIETSESDAGNYFCVFATQDDGIPAAQSFITIYVQISTTFSAPAIQQNGDFLQATGTGLITWYLNGVELLGENSNVLSVIEPGTYYYTLDNGSPCLSVSPEFTVSVTGISGMQDSGIEIFPNPVADQGWTIRADGLIGNYSVNLYAVDGRLLTKLHDTSHIPSEGLENGYYLAVINGVNGSLHKRLVKTN